MEILCSKLVTFQSQEKFVHILELRHLVHLVRRVSEIIVTDRTKAPNLAHLVFEAWALRKSNAPRTWIARKDNYVITEIDNICYLRSAILDLKIFPKRKKTAKNYVKVLKNNKMVQKNAQQEK